MTDPPRRRFHLILEELDRPKESESNANLRRALKYLLRATRLRCRDVRDLPPPEPPRGEPAESH